MSIWRLKKGKASLRRGFSSTGRVDEGLDQVADYGNERRVPFGRY